MPDEAERPSVPGGRFQWLDVLKGILLIAMASYHSMWDLADAGYLDAAFPSTGLPRLYARAIASSFLFISGFSLVLAHGNGIRWKNFGKRLAIIIGAALLVTAATYFAIPQGFIFFGILHEIALASVVGLLFLRLPWPVTVLTAAIVIAAPNYLQPSDVFNPPWLWWVGLSTHTHNSFDYVPVLPWLGVFLLGVAFGDIGAIKDWLRQNARGIRPMTSWMAPFAFLGRHTLVFYLVHQPVLISILYVFSLVVPAPQVTPEAQFIESCEMSCKPDRDENFCRRFCGCALERLQQTKLLQPLQSGAISAANDARVEDIRIECTTLSQ
jgi:uncharacterized membrane protein